MTERYDSIAAAHYAAYRPPLHSIILRRVLSGDELFGVGLDVGCGTGYSAVALAEFCAQVYGVDSSPSMLSQVMAHERVIYLHGEGENIPLANHLVDITTFAGSLFYVDADATCEEITRVSRDGSVVVAYDFEVLLGEVLLHCGINGCTDGSDYDHRVNFSGTACFTELVIGSERVSIPVAASELAHVLLSNSNRFDQFAKKQRAPDPFPALVEELQSAYGQVIIEAEIYYSKYRISRV